MKARTEISTKSANFGSLYAPTPAADKGFSAMLAAAAAPTSDLQMSFGIYHQLSIFNQQQYRAEESQNISTTCPAQGGSRKHWTLADILNDNY